MTQNETQNPATPAEAPESAAQSTSGATGPEAAAAALAAAQAEIAELKDRILRTAAEGENLRKRLEREKEDAAKYASGKFARDILTVADNLRRALDNAPKHAEGSPEAAVISGVEATERELLSVFERHGIARVEPKGQKFDPNLHQAMFEIEDPTVPSGTVVQVVAAGYVQHGRLLRAAMVGVSKGGPQDELQPGAAVNTQA
ncbi:nucleotide exchange factor GrpE [Ferrovibrio xuzhouensis]|uniref:Protein GrpE n=1 Tax=Ferrovibrio xuzhouensis TaxID=1576914 RepID=A0ABV7VFR4_9PROT